jgi:hypothetical protein
MRAFISILLVVTLSFGFILKSVIIINYQINKTNIIAAFCINKDKPELECNGKCYLTQQLSQTESSNESSSLTESILQYEISTFLVPANFKCEKYFYFFSETGNQEEHKYLLSGYLSSVFKPPLA